MDFTIFLLSSIDDYTENCVMCKKTKQSCYLAVITLILLICPGCIRNLSFIKTEYDFEHINEYHQPERYFSKDILSYDDYQNIVGQYTKRFGTPIHSGTREEAMRIYAEDKAQYEGVPHSIWGYATDGNYYTIYSQDSDFLLIIFSSYCGIYLFEQS